MQAWQWVSKVCRKASEGLGPYSHASLPDLPRATCQTGGLGILEDLDLGGMGENGGGGGTSRVGFEQAASAGI